MTILPGRMRSVSYAPKGAPLIADLDLRIEAGAATVIMGPNGAGKSLTLRLLHGLIRPSAGAVEWQERHAHKRQAMVFQRPVLLRRSAAANIDHALAIGGHRGLERTRRREAALDACGLGDLADRPARVLSAGEQQRLALARVWALEPEVLFLDEPTASLDPGATRQVEAIVQRLIAEGRKIVLTTHDIGQARRLAGEVAFLNKGRLLEKTPSERFFDHPQTPEADAFLKGELLW